MVSSAASLRVRRTTSATLTERLRAVLHYAENDAYIEPEDAIDS